jgi:hypothetical protein
VRGRAVEVDLNAMPSSSRKQSPPGNDSSIEFPG